MRDLFTINKIRLIVVLFGSWITIVLLSCSGREQTGAIELEETVDNGREASVIVSKAQFAEGGMATGPLSLHEFRRVIRVNGIFDVPPDYKTSISVYYGGYVKDINILPGQQVKKGQLLFTLEHQDYVQMQREYLEARGQLDYLRSDYERQKRLSEDEATSEKNYLKAKADYEVMLAKHAALEKQLQLMKIDPSGLDAGNMRSTVTIVSPINGYVTTVNATRGKFLDPSDVAVTITNTEHLHLELNVFEQDLPAIKRGQQIFFNVQSREEEEYEAEVFLVGKSVDPEKRTVVIHGHLGNEEDAVHFAPGMYVEARIRTAVDTLLSLPEEAVVNIENAYFVLVKEDSGKDGVRFEKREVIPGRKGDGYIAIKNHTDFEPDAEFLLRGGFNLITE